MILETVIWIVILGLSFTILLSLVIILAMFLIMKEKKKIKENACEHEWITIPIEIEATSYLTIFTLIFGGTYHYRVKVEIQKCRKCNKQIEPDTWGWV